MMIPDYGYQILHNICKLLSHLHVTSNDPERQQTPNTGGNQGN